MGHRLNRVENFDVASASAQVRPEVWGHRLSSQRRAFLRNLVMRSHHNSRNTEAALESATRCECISKLLAIAFWESFEGGDLAPLACVNRLLTCHYGLAIDEHRAAAALPGGRASVFRRRDIEFVSQSREQMGVVAGDSRRLAVHRELDFARHTVTLLIVKVALVTQD